MTDALAVAGVRLAPYSPVLWVSAGDADLVVGTLCLLRTPEGDRSARVVVEPQQLLSEVAPLPGFLAISTLTHEEALGKAPITTLQPRLDQVAHPPCRIDADGSRVTLCASLDASTVPNAGELTRALRIPVVVRDAAGRLPERELPQLGQRVTYEDVAATVKEISVFRREIVLSTDTGELITVPLCGVEYIVSAT